MKDIEGSHLISTRYLSEHDETFLSILNSCPSFMIDAFIVSYLSDALGAHDLLVMDIIANAEDAMQIYGLIFGVTCDRVQRRTLYWFFAYLRSSGKNKSETLWFDFLSNPQCSRFHTADNRIHNSVTEQCFSYILNCRQSHSLGLHHWARKSKNRLWRQRNVTTNNQLKQFAKEHPKCNKPFWALFLALHYLPCLLNKATKSVELIALAKMWAYQYPLSLFPQKSKTAGKAVEHYLTCFDRKE